MIESMEELEKLLDSECAIVFLDADWSVTSKWRKAQLFDKLYLNTQTRHQFPHILFAVIDVTNDSNIVDKTKNWLNEQLGRSQNLIHGNGEMIWIKDGILLEFDRKIEKDDVALERRLQLIQERYLD